ncbi:MAG: cellulase family glycosylhydrolase [Chitinispirillia bacterium]|nr:cellulase family glycosylhydrolase [Chitinispirillia bacterium]
MKKMKLTLLSALYFVFALSSTVFAQSVQLNPPLPAPGQAPAGSPVAKHGRLSINNNRMVSQHGHNVQLRGVSLFWGNAAEGRPFYNDGVVGWLVHDWRIDVVRAAVAVANDPGGGGGAGYTDGDESRQWSQLTTVVEGAIRRGAYVIIDWHTHRATMFQPQTIAFFERAAREWGAHPNIIYEIYNEPCAGGGTAGRCLGEDWNTLRNYSNAVVSAIRAIDPHNVIIIGTRGYSSLENPEQITANPVTGSHLTYALHFYNDDWHWNQFRGRAETILNANRSVFVSEFGASRSDGAGTINTTRTNDWLAFLQTHSVSWAYWAIGNKNEASNVLIPTAPAAGQWTAGHLTASGTYIRGVLRGNMGPAVTNNGITDTTYTINITASDGGTVTKTPNLERYNYGQQVVITATPAEGNEFVSWSGDLRGSSSNTFTVTVRGINLNIGAVFSAGNLIKNGFLANNTSVDWAVTNIMTTGAIVNPVTNNELALHFTGANIGTPTTNPYLNQRDIPLTHGRRYRLSFDARAASPREIAVTVCDNANRAGARFLAVPGTSNPFTVPLTQTNQTFTVEFDVVTANSQNVSSGQVEFWFGGNNTNWFITNIMMSELGPATGAPPNPSWSTSSVQRDAGAATRTAWSVSRTAGGLQLSGPAAGGEARVSLYDVRGRLVKSTALKSGQALTLNKTIAPAGNYLLVVRNGLGKEVFKTRVSLVN